ncbi:MAG: 4,5-dihydroxyphthalate decarboxylase, partial [Caballeronia sp.]|nr:4,5-dihydroxyphthalate decarboxylase [Caballeronia sp.]
TTGPVDLRHFLRIESAPDGDTISAMLDPFVEEQLKAARELLGDDHWSYGIQPNLNTLETFLRHHHSQGLSKRQLTVQEVFHPSTWETAKI